MNGLQKPKEAKDGFKDSKDPNDCDDDVEDPNTMQIRQALFKDITENLTTEQKRGIVPIVFDVSVEDTENQKFEFDLFHLPIETCVKLQKYVRECIQINKGGQQANQDSDIPQGYKMGGDNASPKKEENNDPEHQNMLKGRQ